MNLDKLRKLQEDSVPCTLTKVGSKRSNSQVSVSQSSSGRVVVINTIYGDQMLLCGRIRTSPIVSIRNRTDNAIEIETEGGFYELAWEINSDEE